MINLLPPETKKQIKAARVNSLLIKYLIVSLSAFGFIILSCLMLYVILINTATPKSTTSSIPSGSDSESLKNQIDGMYTSFSSAKSIIQQEISFSSIITTLGANLPDNVIIEKISLSKSNIGTPVSLSAKAKTSNDMAKVKDSLQKNTMFTAVEIKSQETATSASTDYPVTATISLVINRSAQ